MLNYIRAEFYKVLRRKYVYITLGVVLALEGAFLGLMKWSLGLTGALFDFYAGVSSMFVMGDFAFFVIMLTGDMVFAGQYKHSTLKNEVSFGLSRARIYWGKLIVQTLLSLLFIVAMVGVEAGMCWLALPHDPERDRLALPFLAYALWVCLPLWVSAQMVMCALQFLIPNEVGSSITYIMITMILDSVLGVVRMVNMGSGVGRALGRIYQHMPRMILRALSEDMVGDWQFLGSAWLVGAAWLAVFAAIGMYGFHKKEIK